MGRPAPKSQQSTPLADPHFWPCQGHARVLKYLNKVKSSHRHRLKTFLTKLISDKFGRVCQSSIKRVLSVAFTSDCNRGPLAGPGEMPWLPPPGAPVTSNSPKHYRKCALRLFRNSDKQNRRYYMGLHRSHVILCFQYIGLT